MARERLLNGKEIKIIYDQPWFWKVSAYRSEQRSAPREKSAVPKGTPHIQFDTDEEDQKPQRQPQQRPPRQQDTRPQRQDARPQRQDARPQRQDARPQRQDARPQRQDARPQRQEIPQDQRQTAEIQPVARVQRKPVARPQRPKKLEPRSPSSSPPRERVIVKKETPVAEEKKNLVIESDEGELSDA